MTTSPIYSLEQVTKRYNGRTVLNIASLQIRPGEVCAIVGPSGAGKSTLLRLLTFLERPSSGTLKYQNQLVNNQWPDLAARRQVTLVFQRPQLLHRSVAANVAYGLKLRGNKKTDELITAVLKQVGLLELAGANAHTLSGGEMQRVALARALILKPQVLLLDEPTANLDPANIKIIEQIVRQANQEQKTTMIMVTHNTFQARRLADRVCLLLNGRLIEVAATEDFFERPSSPETAAFLSGELIY